MSPRRPVVEHRIPCSVCGSIIVTTASRRRYCSDECRAEKARRETSKWYNARKDDPEFRRSVREMGKHQYARMRNDPVQWAAFLALQTERRSQNLEAGAERTRRWRQANPDARRQQEERRRARKLDAYVEDVDRMILFQRDGGICQLCFEPIDPLIKYPDRRALTTDHRVPLAKGGAHSYANTQIAHFGCNCRKSDKLPTTFPDPGQGAQPGASANPEANALAASLDMPETA